MADNTDGAKRKFAADLTEWFHSLPAEGVEWAEALVVAALDETGGDTALALKLAKEEYAAGPPPFAAGDEGAAEGG